MRSKQYQLQSVRLPLWVAEIVNLGDLLTTEERRMEVAIALASRQVAEKTGGPFGALVCALGSGEVLGIGVNQVTSTRWSSAHAEFVAWSMAQEVRGNYDLGADELAGEVGLYTSAQPCVSCWGGLFWTGISRLVYGATKRDVEDYAGFDEGPVPADWQRALEQRGVSVQGEILREKAVESLQRYQQLGGEQYNAGTTSLKS